MSESLWVTAIHKASAHACAAHEYGRSLSVVSIRPGSAHTGRRRSANPSRGRAFRSSSTAGIRSMGSIPQLVATPDQAMVITLIGNKAVDLFCPPIGYHADRDFQETAPRRSSARASPRKCRNGSPRSKRPRRRCSTTASWPSSRRSASSVRRPARTSTGSGRRLGPSRRRGARAFTSSRQFCARANPNLRAQDQARVYLYRRGRALDRCTACRKCLRAQGRESGKLRGIDREIEARRVQPQLGDLLGSPCQCAFRFRDGRPCGRSSAGSFRFLRHCLGHC